MNKRKHPKDSQFNVRVTPLELATIRHKANEEDISISTLVRRELTASGILPATNKNKS